MAKKKRSGRFWKGFLTVFSLVLIGVGSWALYELINQSLLDLFAKFGIENPYVVWTTIIVFVAILLSLSGYGVWKLAKRLAE
jgi:uncharacterized membrane protein